MTSTPTVPLASGQPRLGAPLCRSLQLREGLDLEVRFEPGPLPVLAMLDPDASGRRFALVDTIEESSGTTRLAFLRILPLDTDGAGAPGIAPVARWRQEWFDLGMSLPGEQLTIQPARAIQNLTLRPPILPPLYLCTLKRVLIPAVCPGCPGPQKGEEAPATSLCPTCGSPARAGAPPPPPSPLEALWRRVRKPSGVTAEGAPDLYCVGCDRQSTCYPAAGPSAESGTAGSVLVPISAQPWGGVVVEPFHLPLASWFRLVAGGSWAQVRRELKMLPAVILEEVEERLRLDRRFLFSSESVQSLGLESFLLKLETLRQILVALHHLAVRRGHPHLGLTPDLVWIRLLPSDGIRTALWSFRVQLLDLAPGQRGDGGADGESYGPPPSRPEMMTPPGCGDAEEWVSGTCILKTGTITTVAPGLARVEFLPGVPFSRPPAKGDVVRIAVPTQDSARPVKTLPGRVDAVYPEMCRIVVHDPSTSPVEMEKLFGGGSGGARVRMRVVRDHSLVDDLFAAGTLWLGSLLSNPGDFTAAAKFRDDLSPKLRGTKAGGGDTLVRESIRAAEDARIFALAPRGAAEAATARAGVAVIERDLLARALALGMRLCAAVPGGYPCQNHEPAGAEERNRAYETLLSIVVELSRQVRERLLGAPGAEDEILRVLGTYVRERAEKERGAGG